jgi:hypothetical protein
MHRIRHLIVAHHIDTGTLPGLAVVHETKSVEKDEPLRVAARARQASTGITRSVPEGNPHGVTKKPAQSRLLADENTSHSSSFQPMFGPGLSHFRAAPVRSSMSYARDMTIRPMDNVGIVFDDLAAAVAFFLELGLELEARRQSRDLRWTASAGSTTLDAASH